MCQFPNLRVRKCFALIIDLQKASDDTILRNGSFHHSGTAVRVVFVIEMPAHDRRAVGIRLQVEAIEPVVGRADIDAALLDTRRGFHVILRAEFPEQPAVVGAADLGELHPVFVSKDANEGIKAFGEKRKPEFTGE